MKVALIKYPKHESVLVDSFNTFFEWESYLDLIFICDKNVKVRAHKMILASVSKFIKDVILTSNQNGQETVFITVPDVNHRTMKMLLAFLYEGSMKVDQDELCEMKIVLKMLGIHLPAALDSTMEDMSIALSSSSSSSTSHVAEKELKVEDVTSLSTTAVINFIDDPLNTPDFYFSETQAISTSVSNAVEVSPSVASSTPVEKPPSKFPVLMPRFREEEPEQSVSVKEEVLDDDTFTNEMDNSSEYNDAQTSNDAFYSSVGDEDMNSMESMQPHDSPVPSSSSKKRFVFTDWHLSYLEDAYSREKFPDLVLQDKLSDESGVPRSVIKNWFTHRRAKDRKNYYNMIKNTRHPEDNPPQDNAIDLSQHAVSSPEYEHGDSYSHEDAIAHVDVDTDLKHDIIIEQDIGAPHFLLGRRKLTKRQVNRLEREYRKCKYLDNDTLEQLSVEMNVHKNRLRKWFQKKRVKSGNTLKRNKFSDEQLSYLHEEYEKNKNPTGEVLDQLQQMLDLPRVRIQNWFANKRLKEGITLRRRKYTDEQINRMEEEYLKNKHPDIEVLEQLANELEVPKVCLQNWFSNKRMKEGINLVRRQFTEQQQSTLEEEYKKNKNPDNEILEKLAGDLGIAEVHLQDWFSYKRMVEGNYMKRSKFNEHQLNCLEEEYRKNKYPDIDYLEQLAEELDIPKVKVQGWFSNKRMKEGNFKWKKLSEEQVKCLEKEYKKNKNPTIDIVEQLADELGIPEIHLQDWFAYKRMMEGISLKHSKFNEQQLNSLEEEYRKNKYPNVELLEELSGKLGLTKERLQKWYINKRKKEGVSLKWRNFTEQQMARLDEEYRKNKDPNMDLLSGELGIPKIHLRDWFAYRRKMEETSFKRSSFTEQELHYLEDEYRKNKHPNMDQLSMELGVPKIRLQNWFSNKRTREGTAMKRIRFSDEQLRCLEEEYRKNQHPSIHLVEHLAFKLGIQKIRIQAWFAKKRTKDGVCAQRNRFTEQQLSCLVKEYRKNKRPSTELIEQLADELKVPKVRLQTWFSKQRMKEGLNRRKYFKSVM